MPLEDVSNDRQMIDWLRQSGHGHLIDDRISNIESSSAPLAAQPSPAAAAATSLPFVKSASSTNYPPQQAALSSASPIFNTGLAGLFGAPSLNNLNQSTSAPQPDYRTTTSYGGGGGGGGHPLATSSPLPLGASPFGQHSSPLHFDSSPTQLLGSNTNQQLDYDIEVKYLF